MEHNQEIHIQYLNELCRTCGHKNITQKRKKISYKIDLCEDNSADILLVFGVEVEKDFPEKHSKFICGKCLSRIRNFKQRQSDQCLKNARESAEESNYLWCFFAQQSTLSSCTVCSKRMEECKGGRSQNNTHHGHENTTLTQTIISPSTETSTATLPPQSDIESAENSTLISAPPSPIAFSTPSKRLRMSTVNVVTSPMTKHFHTIEHSLNKSLEEPLTKIEQQLLTHLIKRKLNTEDKHKNVIKCKTKGQPLAFQKITLSRKDSSTVRTPTKRRRAKQLEKTRSLVAGTSREAEEKQIAMELRRIPQSRRSGICKKAGISCKLKIDRKHVLAMKEALGLSWRQGRKQASLLKEAGVQLENETYVRQLSREIVGNLVQVEYRSFLNEENSNSRYDAPFGSVVSLIELVDKLLDSYSEKQLLTWHNGCIPHNEIWVKIGGDHGKKSLKFTLQIVNTEKPNSQKNTVVIAMAPVRDSHENLTSFIEGRLGRDIASLETHTWKNKTIRLFLNGDYAFLCKIYGISGPSGTFPCLWCLMSRKAIHTQTFSCQHRSISSLVSQHSALVQNEGGQKKHAAKYFNALHSPLLYIPLERVAPPYLHILLGIVLKHHHLLEKAAHRLDLKVFYSRELVLTRLGQIFKMYGRQWSQVLELRNKIDFYKACETLSETEEDIKKYHSLKKETKHSLLNIKHKPVTLRSGPIASSLDTILDQNRITPQSYHSSLLWAITATSI